jgi:hypothetical protein
MIKKILFSLQVLVMIFASSNIYADSTKPVMIIRFQNENIEYKRSLQMLINTALKNHPNLTFKIVANVPSGNKEEAQKAEIKSDSIKQEMIDQGVRASNIEVSFKENNELNYNEIHIYTQE